MTIKKMLVYQSKRHHKIHQFSFYYPSILQKISKIKYAFFGHPLFC